MASFDENFLVTKRLYPRLTDRFKSRLEVQQPQSKEEREYRDLLTEANENYFHREYSIALQNYLELRQKILVQSHPEMPHTHGPWLDGLAVSKVDFSRIMELSRRHYIKVNPGEPITLPLKDESLIRAGEFPTAPFLEKFLNLGLDTALPSKLEMDTVRESARKAVLEGDLDAAQKVYTVQVRRALQAENTRLAAELEAESAAMLATYAAGESRKPALERALNQFGSAQKRFGLVGDVNAQQTMQANLETARKELSPQVGAAPQTANLFQVVENATIRPAVSIIAAGNAVKTPDRKIGLLVGSEVKTLSLGAAQWQANLSAELYQPRVTAKALDAIRFWEEIDTNFVAYIPHLFFFVLPIAVGDTYLALGNYQPALNEYEQVLPYPFLNSGIEAPYVWLRMAKVCLEAGDNQFRRENPALARAHYEKIIKTDLTVPLASSLYASAAMTPMRGAAQEAVKQIQGQPSAAINPKVAQYVMKANMQLQKIANGLNFFGLGATDFSVFRFKFLQSAANYLADTAIQTERTFINFRTTAENQKLDRIQLENAVQVNQASLAVEQKRLEDAALEVQAASQTRQLSELRRDNANATLDDWNTLGRDLASVNAALSWASNAANDQDITYTGVHYDGQSHDFDTDVEEFYDVVGEWRENLNFEIQQNRLERQAAEAAAEVPLAQTREQQAMVRFQTQQLSIQVAQKRLEGAQDMLDYATDRTFDEDLWFQLAAEMQDLAREYLDMAIYAGLLMERAYELEFDRDLNRIRQDYGIGGVENLLGGDYLKRDIASFTIDYLQHAQKKNPVRCTISLRDEFPAEFAIFLKQGLMPFRTDLEIFDRRYPGTYRRKIKKIEVFVEGLVPLDGAVGYLHNQGVSSEWSFLGGAWVKKPRIMPAEQVVLSSYQFRRDISVFQPSEELLDLFENLGPQCNWLLELPMSGNNLDYEAISDVKFVVYFDSDYSESLRTFLKGFYPTDGGKSVILSSRFHFPDQYFRLDADRKAAFLLHPARFWYNYTNLRLAGMGVRIIPKTGASAAGLGISVTRDSDGASVNAVTDANGLVLGDAATMAPFQAWKDASPVDTFTVALADGVDTSQIADIQFSFDYRFTYRPDGALPA